jgi:hypothetical protein
MTTGRLTTVPSIEYRPSTMSRIFFHGRCVRGMPCEMHSRSRLSSSFMSLCLNCRMLAPDRRAPKRSDEWLYSSEMISVPAPAMAGIVVEFVAKPIEMMHASGWPTKRATRRSACACRSSEPAPRREPNELTP